MRALWQGWARKCRRHRADKCGNVCADVAVPAHELRRDDSGECTSDDDDDDDDEEGRGGRQLALGAPKPSLPDLLLLFLVLLTFPGPALFDLSGGGDSSASGGSAGV